MGRGARAVAAIAWSALVAGAAHAEAPAAPPAPSARISVQYDAPPGCPSARDFEAAVTGRSARVVLADEATATTVVRVRLRGTERSFAGELVVEPRGREGVTSTRDVEDPECAVAVDALALVTALALDPNAALAQPMPPRPPAPPPPQPEPPAVVPPEPAPQEGRPVHWRLNAGLEGNILAGPAPDAMLGGGAYGEVEASRESIFSPSARIAVIGAVNGAFDTRTAAFSLVVARVDVCPLRLASREGSFWLRSCVGVDAGEVLAHGLGLPITTSKAWPWAAPLLLARAGWDLPEVGGVRTLVGVDVGADLPLTRPTFVYDSPSVTIHTPPAAAPVASLTLGVRFW